MKRDKPMKAFAIRMLWGMALAVWCGDCLHAADRLPNIVFILADDQGWNATTHRANPDLPGSGSTWFKTPHLDQLARDGMRFSRAYSPGPSCSPSRHAIQWGRSPVSLKIFGADGIKQSMIDARPEDSLANTLKRLRPEYACAHLGKWHVAYGTDRLGFEVNTGNPANLRRSPDPRDPKFIFSLTQKANAFMDDKVKAGRPFLLQISHYADHLFYEALPETVAKYEKRADDATEYHRDPLWAAMNENLDTGIGLVLKKIDELGIRDSTYVIYTADNGYESKRDFKRTVTERGYYKAHPQRSHKYTVSEGGIRVPFIVRGPGVPAGVHSEAQVVGTDIYPTILDLVGKADQIPEQVEGVSLLEHLESGGRTKLKLLRPDPYLVFKHSKPMPPHDATIIQGDLKWIRSLSSDVGHLFNLRDDIGESRDLSAELPDKARAMDKALMEYLQRSGWTPSMIRVQSRSRKQER
jgi:arylsulfatase A